MMSTTARYPIKPKTLTLLEVCQSINDFRPPPPSISSYQHGSASNTAQILTRRLYLHPLSINSNAKQQLPKTSTSASTAVNSSDNDQRLQLNSEKNRRTHHTNNKLTHRGLAVLSSSFPLITRVNPKPDTRHSRDKISVHTDDDTISEYDASTTSGSLNLPSLRSIARGTLSSTHTTCTRPALVMNRRKTHRKANRLEKANVWRHLDRTLQRPMPHDPPTTPLGSVLDFNIEYDQLQNSYSSFNSVQGIKNNKRNPIRIPLINEDHDYDD